MVLQLDCSLPAPQLLLERSRRTPMQVVALVRCESLALWGPADPAGRAARAPPAGGAGFWSVH